MIIKKLWPLIGQAAYYAGSPIFYLEYFYCDVLPFF